MKSCNCGNTKEYIYKHPCPNKKKAIQHFGAKEIRPYHKAKVGGVEYLDYSVNINGITYSISVNTVTNGLYVDKDEHQ